MNQTTRATKRSRFKKIRTLEESLHRFQMDYARSDSRAQQLRDEIADPNLTEIALSSIGKP